MIIKSGTITCTRFVDANGKKSNSWISPCNGAGENGVDMGAFPYKLAKGIWGNKVDVNL